MTSTCETYWGTHGCALERDHEGHHFCCCECPPGQHPNLDPDEPQLVCVGTYPYYGPDVTRFYGADATTVSTTELH